MLKVNLSKLIKESARIYIEHFAGDKNKLLALDLGCGSGRSALILEKSGFMVHAVDKNEERVSELCKVISDNPGLTEKIRVFIEDVNFFDYGIERYDIVAAINILHLLGGADYFAVIDKIYNSLKRNGQFIAVIKLERDVSEKHFLKFKIIKARLIKDTEGMNYFLLHAIKP